MVAVRKRYLGRFESLLLAIFLLGGAACGASDSSVDAGITIDATPDTGVAFVCGNESCVLGSSFCLQAVVGECQALDGGSCPESSVMCSTADGGPGCAPTQSSCAALPDGCDRCACLLSVAVCGDASINFDCSMPANRIDVRCRP
ncbi:MAG: hypothetical protein AAFN74_11025 [Myxococcota bacterium]